MTTISASAQTQNYVAKFNAGGSSVNSSIFDNGSIGIGTTNPQATLSILKSGSANGALSIGADTSTNSASVSINYNATTAQALVFNDLNANGRRWSLGSGIGTAAGFFGIYDQNAGSTRMAIDTSGNMGIGSSSPDRGLVVGTSGYWNGTSGIAIKGANPGLELADTEASPQKWLMANGVNAANDGILGLAYDEKAAAHRLVVLPGSGNVGIGTTNPDRALVVGSTGLWNGASGIAIKGANPGLEFADTEAAPQKWLMGNGVNAANDGILGLAYDEKAAAHRLVVLPGSGNIGLGTNFPGARLEVNGSVKISAGSSGGVVFPDATTQTTAWTGVLCGGDYAESVDVSGARTRYEPGDIIVIDLADPENFTKSTAPYSKTVAGIYSTKPGAVGRRFTDPDKVKSEIPMAMIGIVPTKVSAENGPIERGDLLVTSATAGYAMKGTDNARMLGAVVGKALGSLHNGTGVINVLVTLQ